MALLHVDFFSDVLGMCAEMDVILPERTRGQIGMEGKRGEGKYPVLYLLHGMSDDHTIWQRRTSIERYAADYGIAVVMPSTQLGWYTDMHIGFPWFTYITQELPAICRSFFPNMSEKREDTFVAGLSMGGYGAMKLALTYPERFAAAASFSGAVDAEALLRKREPRPTMRRAFGTAKAFHGSENDLFHLMEENAQAPHKPRLYVACGTEDFLFGHHKKFVPALEKNGWDVTHEETPGFGHEWAYWDAQLAAFLPFALGD